MPDYYVKINGSELPKIKTYKVGRYKLQSEAGRNLAGTLRTTLIGIFPKIFLEFAPTTENEMDTLVTLLDNGSFTLLWWDIVTRSHKTGTYYAGDFDYSTMQKSKGMYESFSVNLIPFSKMT